MRCIRARVLILPDALVVTNWYGAEAIRLAWDDITELTDAYPHIPFFTVWSGSHRVKISSFQNLTDIADEIRSRAPRLATPPAGQTYGPDDASS